jgi:lipopolysaccharide/colanic/teichoic acid biosynthesis glycosyltransferase
MSDTTFLSSSANVLYAAIGRRTALKINFDAALRRMLDLLVAGAAIVFLLPLFFFVALAVVIQDGGSVLYTQHRLGMNDRLFRCWKFRTMVTDASERLEALLAVDPVARLEWSSDCKLREDPRITWLGSFLRRSSLDELPQLFNIIKGDMSIVGPRPIVQSEVVRYASRYRYYCKVKPGLTGLWQVNGRNDTTYNRRVALDTLYVRHQSVLLNLKILAATVPAIVFARGSY